MVIGCYRMVIGCYRFTIFYHLGSVFLTMLESTKSEAKNHRSPWVRGIFAWDEVFSSLGFAWSPNKWCISHIYFPKWCIKAKFYWNLPYIAITIDLVDGWPTPLKNHGVQVSWDDEIPNWMEKKRFETNDEIPNKWKVIKFPGSNQPTRSNIWKNNKCSKPATRMVYFPLGSVKHHLQQSVLLPSSTWNPRVFSLRKRAPLAMAPSSCCCAKVRSFKLAGLSSCFLRCHHMSHWIRIGINNTQWKREDENINVIYRKDENTPCNL